MVEAIRTGRWNWRRIGPRLGGVVGWFLLCAALTAWWISILRDFVISNVLVSIQAVWEFPEVPAVATVLFPGIAIFLLIAAWWRPLRGAVVAILCVIGLCAAAYGIGTLCYGGAIGLRPVNGVLTLLFLTFLASPGVLRLMGFRWLSVAGMEIFLVLVAVSAFRGEVSSLYSHGVQWMAYGVFLTPWLIGWGGFEAVRGIVRLVRYLCFGVSDPDDDASEEDGNEDDFPTGPITFHRRVPE